MPNKSERAQNLNRGMKKLTRDMKTLQRIEQEYGPAVLLSDLYLSMERQGRMIYQAAQELKKTL